MDREMSVYGYARVSTSRQASDGESLDVQQRQVEGYAMQHGMKIKSFVVEEGVSGSIALADRPKGKLLVRRLQEGDVLIAAKLDRLFRSALDALRCVEDFKARGVRIHLLDLGGDVAGNGLSKLFLTIAAAFAEAERARIAERVQQVKSDQKRRGRFLGGPAAPFGFAVNDDGMLTPQEREQAAIEVMGRLRNEGMSLREIESQVALAFPDVRRVSHVAIRRILQRSEQ